ncbi:hypothetical protein WJX72_005842 [[Myrmecia] bisecta]|uniref:SnoaL-like domain-containing protein n=1 Tax=[Myrmecia] bisecta TaxID=41462 RepID=A0AAW1P9R6_9CHLO
MADVVRQAYDLFHKGNIRGIMELCTDDVEFVQIGKEAGIPFAGQQVGKDNIPKYFFKALAQRFKTEDIKLSACVESMDSTRVTATGTWTAVPRDKKEHPVETARTVVPFCHVYNMEGHKIRRVQSFIDTCKVARAMRLAKAHRPEE